MIRKLVTFVTGDKSTAKPEPLKVELTSEYERKLIRHILEAQKARIMAFDERANLHRGTK